MRLPSFAVAAAWVLLGVGPVGATPGVFPGTQWEEAAPESRCLDPVALRAAVDFLRANAPIPGMRRFVQSHTRLAVYERGREPPWDGVGLTWFDDTDALRAATTTPEWERASAEYGNFLAPGPLAFIGTTEHVIVG